MTGKNWTAEHFGLEVESVIPSTTPGGQITNLSAETYAVELRKTNRWNIGAIARKGAAMMEPQRTNHSATGKVFIGGEIN